MNFQTTCYFPCFCAHCHDVVQVNLLAHPATCTQCGNPVLPYDDPTLSEGPGKECVADWNTRDELGRELLLTDGGYRCPGCGRMTLRFRDTGLCWD
jgi:DNA-directed RNA polymerase subunit RPC12/RpoP